jgi:hypothetical protein
MVPEAGAVARVAARRGVPGAIKEVEMKYFAALLPLLLLISGCEVAPSRVEDPGLKFKSARTPYSAAICIARNARNETSGVRAEEKTLGDASWEVRVASRSGLLAVAEIHDDGVGSSVSLRVTPAVSGSREDYARRLMAGC